MEWRASHILVKDRSQAEMILKKLKEGETFSSLAKEYSSCPSKAKGGDLGWFGPGMMVKEFEDAVTKGSGGGVKGPVKTQFGFHVIKKTGQR